MFARTPRLLLRPGFPEDAPALATAIADEAIVRNLATVPWPYRMRDAEAFLASPRDPVLPSLLIFERTAGAPQLVGACGLGRRPSGAVEMGYWIARAHWGNGFATEACTALVDQLTQPITLEPMRKFRVVRDLQVDRSRMFEALKRVKAWIPIDGTYDLGPGPAVPQKVNDKRYPLSRCISCGCCLEACPQYTPTNKFVGAAVISQARLFNDHPTGSALKDERLEALMGEGGVADCGKAGNCVEVCPKDIPLLESIAAVQRQATVYAIKKFFTK